MSYGADRTCINVGVTLDERERIADAAARVGLTPSAWLRSLALAAADKSAKRVRNALEAQDGPKKERHS